LVARRIACRTIPAAIDQQEAAGVAHQRIGIHGDRLVGRDLDAADVVHLKDAGRLLMAAHDIESMSHVGHGGRDRARPGDEQVRTAVGQRLLAEPNHVGREPVGGRGQVRVGRGDHVTARDVDLVVQGDGDRLAHVGMVEVGDMPLDVQVVGDDAVDTRGAPGVGDDHLVALGDGSRHDGACVPAEVPLGPDDELHREPERVNDLLGIGPRAEWHPLLQGLEDRRPVVPRHHRAGDGDVVAGDGAHRDGDDLGHVEPGGGGAHQAGDLLEGGVLVSDEVHLVHGDDDGLDPHESADGEVPMGLGADASRRIDHEDGDIAVRRGDRHVARVLLVSGRVCDQDAAAVGQVHVPIGDVDGDALLALGLQSVGEQGVVDVAHGDRRSPTTGATGVLERVERDRVGLGEQPPDERGLAVVDRAAGDQVQDGSEGAGH
jgi:hypothetical protein